MTSRMMWALPDVLCGTQEHSEVVRGRGTEGDDRPVREVRLATPVIVETVGSEPPGRIEAEVAINRGPRVARDRHVRAELRTAVPGTPHWDLMVKVR